MFQVYLYTIVYVYVYCMHDVDGMCMDWGRTRTLLSDAFSS